MTVNQLGPVADRQDVSGQGTPSRSLFDGLDGLDRDVQASLLLFLGCANCVETRHRRNALVRELVAHLVSDAR